MEAIPDPMTTPKPLLLALDRWSAQRHLSDLENVLFWLSRSAGSLNDQERAELAGLRDKLNAILKGLEYAKAA